MDSQRRRRKQQEKKTSPSYIRRKRSASKISKKSKPAASAKTHSLKKRKEKSTKKISKKRSSPRARPRSTQDLGLNIKDGWIKLLIFLFIAVNGFLIYSLVKQWTAPKNPVKSVTTKGDSVIKKKKEPKKVIDSAPLQIEVLNGCGVSGIAAEFTEYLRKQGFDVVKTENYESFNVLETVIIDRRDKSNRIKEIAKSLGLDPSRILKEINEAYLIDATVILGKDYRRISSWNKMEHNDY